MSDTARRKRDHLSLALDADVGFTSLETGLDRVRLHARALPEHDLDRVDLSLPLWGRQLAAPLLVSCMTGGVSEAGSVNRALAVAAQHHRVALGLGSGRILLEEPEAAIRDSFAVRDVAPDVLLLANLGAVQLRERGPADCARLVELCEADVLVLHLNAVQEAVQVGGDTTFAGLAEAIADVCAALDVPVVVKEVGFGMAPEDVAVLADAGVAGVDVAGAGGTNWARVEGLRDDRAGAVAAGFADWGWPTTDAVRAARAVLGRRPRAGDRGAPGARTDGGGQDPVVLIGSGGLRHGVDAAKVLCLGADLAGAARGLLRAAAAGAEPATEAVGVWVEQLRIAAWACGASGVDDLGPSLIVPPGYGG